MCVYRQELAQRLAKAFMLDLCLSCTGKPPMDHKLRHEFIIWNLGPIHPN